MDFLVPFSSNPWFIGRGEALQEIEASKNVAILKGPVGVGKSQLAIEYAYRFKSAHSNGVVIWLPSRGLWRFSQSIREIGRSLSKPLEIVNLSTLVKWLTNNGEQWLLILDDLSFQAYANNEKRSFFDTMAGFNSVSESAGKVLVTTSNIGDWENCPTLSNVTSIPVTNFSRQEAFLFLDVRLPPESSSRDEKEYFVESLGRLPLSLNLACSAYSYWVESEKASMQEELLADSILLKMRRHSLDQTAVLPPHHPVVRTIVDEIELESPLALRMLCFMSVIDIQGVPLTLLTLCCNQTNPWRSDFHRALQKLHTVSMIQHSRDGSTLFLDEAIRDYVHEKMENEKTLTFWEGKAVEYLAEVFPEGDESFWPQCETLLPHALAALICEPADSEARIFHARLMCKTASYSQQLGEFDDAHQLYHKAADIYQEIKGKEALITLETSNHVATSLYYLRRNEEAEEISLRILDSYRKYLPPDHYIIQKLYNSLSIISEALGKYENALEYGTQAVTCYEKTYGPKHPNTLIAKWNLAGTLSGLCHYAKALKIYEEILAAYREQYGETYTDVPETMGAIASVLIDLNRVEEGINMHRKAIELMSHILEATHPIVLAMHSKFGKALSTVGRLTEAAEMQRRNLETYLLLHPSPSTQSLVPASNLAITLEKMSRFNEAREVLEQAATLAKEAQLSATHPSVLAIQNVLAVVQSRLGDNVNAEDMLRELLVKNEELFGKLALQVFTVMNDLGGVLQRQKKFPEAVEMQKEALHRCIEKLGQKARFTMRVRNDLGESLRLWGEKGGGHGFESGRLLKEAEECHHETLKLRVEVLSDETLDTWISKVNYGYVLQSLGKTAEARNYSIVLGKLEAVVGSNNEVVQRGRQRLDLLEARKASRDKIGDK